MYSYECCLVDNITCALLPQKGAIRRSWWVDSQPWNQAWVCVHWPAAMREPYQGHSWLFFYRSPRLLTGESAVAFWHINPKLWPEPTTTVKYVCRPGLCVQPKGTPLVQTHDNHRRSEQGRPQRSYMVYKSSPQSLWNQGPVLWKANFSTDQGWEGRWFQDDSSALHLSCTLLLLLHQLHFRSSGIRSQRMVTPGLWDVKKSAAPSLEVEL